MSLKNYYSNSNNYKAIYNKKYEVSVYRPSTGTIVHNIFTGNYEKTSTYKPFIVVGPLGDESVVSWSTLTDNYETTDGKPADNLLGSLKPNVKIKLVYKNITKKYFVAMVPYRIVNAKIFDLICNPTSIPLNGHEQICMDFNKAIQNISERESFVRKYVGGLKVRGQEGNTILYNYEVPHSTGDFIVCESLPDGSGADFQTAICVNGCLFEQCFDMRYISSISINLFSILIEIEMKKDSVDGFKLMSVYNAGNYGKMQYEFVSDSNLANEHNLLFKLLVNNKIGKFYAVLNKTSKDISAYIECFGQKRALLSYSVYKKKYLELCRQKNIKEMNDLELLVKYVEKIVIDACNFIYGAQLQISKETEKLAELLVQETKKMFRVFGQGSIRAEKEEEKQGYRIYTVIYQHDLYGIESKSGIKIKLDDSTVEACILDNNTKRTVTLVNKKHIQNEGNIKEFINAYKSNLIQVVSGAAFK